MNRSDLELDQEIAMRKFNRIIEEQEQAVHDYQANFDRMMTEFYQYAKATGANNHSEFQQASNQVIADYQMNLQKLRQQVIKTDAKKREVKSYFENTIIQYEATQKSAD